MKFGKRVILDTSTLVGALLSPDSIPRQAFRQALAEDELCASASTLAELTDVLGRSKFDRYLDLQTREAFVQLYRTQVRMFDVPANVEEWLKVHCRDPRDNKFLALAEVGAADVIVSSDEDLLALHPYSKIQILTPRQFIDRDSHF